MYRDTKPRRSLIAPLISRLRFARDESGTITVESVIILPMILFLFMAAFVWFESYRQASYTLKANYAVADFISRQSSISSTDMNGLDNLFEFLSKTDESSWVRFSLVSCDDKCDDEATRELSCVLSKSTSATVPAHSTSTVRAYLSSHIPLMYKGQQLIVVETSSSYVAPLSGGWTGMGKFKFKDLTITSPREFSTITWSGSGAGGCA